MLLCRYFFSQAMIDALKRVFSNTTRSLEMLYLLADMKPAVRLDANEQELAAIRTFCADNKLALTVSDFKLVKVQDAGKGGYSNRVQILPASSSESGLVHVYISKDANKATMLKLMEAKQDDAAVGQLLGYPDCCIAFFEKHKATQQQAQNDYILPALHDSEGFEFPFQNNYVARYLDATLLSHFPCTFSCVHSKEQAQKRLDLLQKNDADFASEFEKRLQGAFLYTEDQGVFHFPDATLENNRLTFAQIEATTKNDFYKKLQEQKQCEIASNTQLVLDGAEISSIGFFYFR